MGGGDSGWLVFELTGLMRVYCWQRLEKQQEVSSRLSHVIQNENNWRNLLAICTDGREMGDRIGKEGGHLHRMVTQLSVTKAVGIEIDDLVSNKS